MKIIKEGTKELPNKKIYVAKCRTCGCKFTYMEKDIKFFYLDESGIICPQCNYWVSPFIKRKYKGDVKNENNNI